MPHEVFEDTYLHDIAKLGGMQPIGAGTPGGTLWASILAQPTPFKDTFLNDITKLGGMEPIGAGSPGGTVWEVVTT